MRGEEGDFWSKLPIPDYESIFDKDGIETVITHIGKENAEGGCSVSTIPKGEPPVFGSHVLTLMPRKLLDELRIE